MIKGTFSDKGPWTQFWDMHSGGRCKEGEFDKIYVQLPEEKAEIFFYNRFGHNPHRISCSCCGSDYDLMEYDSFAEASAYQRDANVKNGEDRPNKPKSLGKYVTVETYVEQKNVLVICKDDIKENETVGDVPEQGYVWVN